MAEERERDNPASDPEATKLRGGFKLNKEWLKKHWIELVAAGAGVIAAYLLFRGRSSSSPTSIPQQASVPTSTPTSGSSGGGTGSGVDTSGIASAIAALQAQEASALQAMQNIGNQDAASQQTIAAEVAAIQAEIASLNGTGSPGSSSGSFPNTINPIPGGPLPGSYTPLPGGGQLINVPAPGGRTGTTVTAGPTAALTPVGAVLTGGTVSLPSVPNVSSGYGPVVVPIPSAPTGSTGQIQTPPAPPPNPIVSGQNPTRPGAPPIPS